jgi:diguanylate cyclase (GGDEF)-like protein/PAS domain S-box-containing protein
MDRVLNCVSQQHDWRLVALAGIVCCLSGVAAIHLYRRAYTGGRIQTTWAITAGVVTGCGIWATHFIGILAYQPGVAIAFDIPLTVLSLLAAAAITSAGFWIALGQRSRFNAPLGGGVVGVGIAAMHYTGIAALIMPATVQWSVPYVVASIGSGIALGAAALWIASLRGKFATGAAAATLSLAILALHFTGMAAITLVDDPAHAIRPFSFDASALALAIAGAAIATLGMGLIAALYDRRLASNAAQYERNERALVRQSEERLRARNLQLDAALNNMSQALCMFDANGRLIICNGHYATLFDLPPELQQAGASIEDVLSHKIARGMFPGEDAEAYRRDRLMIVANNAPSHSQLEFRDGRTFSVWHQPMAQGGWVATHQDITEQMKGRHELLRLHATLEDETSKALDAAAKAEAAHQRLVDASNIMGHGLVLFDAEDRHVLWNQRYAELLGEARDALAVGVSFEDIVRASLAKGRYAGDGGRGEAWVEQRLAGHRRAENSFEMMLTGGQWIRVDERRTADGGSIGVRIDITQMKRREESLRLMFAGNPLPMFVFDKETLGFLDVNDAAIVHYGWTREEFLAMTLYDIRPTEDAEKLRTIAGSRDGSILNGMVWRHFKKSGEEIEVALYSRLLEYGGRAASLVAIVDVTQSRRAEAEVLRTREFLDSIVANVPAPIIVKDARTFQHVLINRAAEAHLGVTMEQVVGKTAEEIYPPASAALIRERDESIVKDRKEAFFEEGRFVTPGNGTRYASARRMPVLDEKGEPRYILTVLDDRTERRQADERIAHLTSHDVLTGLPNRAAFGERLAAALDHAPRQGVAVLWVDLDRFKDINDVHGHVVSDRVLSVVAQRLREFAGDIFVARVGGDEFSLIAADAAWTASASEIAEAFVKAAAEGIDIDDGRIHVGLSIGVAVSPADGTDAVTLVANAQAALHRAKSEGRGTARFFEAGMDQRLRENRALEHDLKAALELGQLRLHYQPQTNVKGGLIGFEALVRWQHPTRGLVPPGVFIPIAEESGLIVEIGAWILREACHQAASWPRDLTIAVNLSPAQFRQSDFFALIHSVLVETGLSGSRLELEITEGVLIADSSAALAVLRRAKSLGVSIAIDDFGTGFSSLSYLQSFPFDKIKIDRSFIAGLDSNPQAAAIVRGVLGLARGLNLPVVAEGVETEAQLAFLEREGCDEIQGYLMGRPRPIEEYAGWIARGAYARFERAAVA